MSITDLPRDTILQTLEYGTLNVSGQFVWGSNYTFLAEVNRQGLRLPAVYKPMQGERPLWDFPPQTLAVREVAAYLTAQTLGWDLVPPTVFRQDGPAGAGSLQLFVDVDPERHYFNFNEEERQRLRPVVAFDILINNADRKGGHILIDPDDHLWLIDHGICFHQDFKLRTVVWDFVGETIPEPILSDLQSFLTQIQTDTEVQTDFQSLLSAAELEAIANRASWLISEMRFPEPPPGRSVPWPLV
jgi:uncharacterized repeat protein (TIGR03843 family)